jgi:ribosomal protein S12 methylthiotransferase accessory factor YcaO
MPQSKPKNHAASQPVANYELAHLGTELGTGWFAPMPAGPVDFEQGLEYIEAHPNDIFLRKYLLEMASTFGPNMTRQLIDVGKEGRRHLLALMYEACVLNERLVHLKDTFQGENLEHLTAHTPLLYVAWSRKPDQAQTAYWIHVFTQNIMEHKELISPDKTKFPVPFAQTNLDAWERQITPLRDVVLETGPPGLKAKDVQSNYNAAETAKRALASLNKLGLEHGQETENPSSFSPYALQIQWPMEVRVAVGRNRYQLKGVQTSYGKGLNADAARASCLMEVVERVSSWASFDSDKVLHYKNKPTLIHGRYGDLSPKKPLALDPNDLRLEIPYENQPLYWVQGEQKDQAGTHSILVPAQLVYLFSNLDEISLTSGLSSTGLASGNTMEEAKLHALLEVIERDSERLMPYLPDRCFFVDSNDTAVTGLLDRAKAEGAQVQFLDITTELGIPCYKAFIEGPNGEILKGCAAHLDGSRAAISALLEVPYHESWFRPEPEPERLKIIKQSDLPNYSSDNSAKDLDLLEALLVANGYSPVYVDLTREDLDIPVVKAIIPGLEMFADFDAFSSLSLRQFAHYLDAVR